MSQLERAERPERGFDDAYSVGWSEADPLEEIRQFRTEIQLNDTFQYHHKNGQMPMDELISKTIASLQEKFKYKPEPDVVMMRLVNFNFKYGHLLRDPKNQTIVLKGRFF